MLGRWIAAYALIVSILLGTAFGSLALSPQAEVERAASYLPIKLEVDMGWALCGSWNGSYWKRYNYIRLCYENLEEGVGPARFIYLHELGHAYTMGEDDFDYTRWDGNYEAAADEFAAIMSLAQGHPEDLLAVARMFERESASRPYRKGDPHPPLLRRAETLRRLYLGYVVSWSRPAGFDLREALAFWKSSFIHRLESEVR